METRRALARLALLAGWLAACASPAGPAQLSGSVSYRERSALPEGAVVHVALLDVSRVDGPARVIAQREIRPTHQVPIPFVLEYDRAKIERGHRHGLRATISDASGRLLFANVTTHPALREGGEGPAAILVQRVQTGGSGPLSYACAGFEFGVETTPERARLTLPGGRRVELPAVPAASGAKYSDGTTTFWGKGDEARLELDGVEHRACRVRAKPGP